MVLERYCKAIEEVEPILFAGRIERVRGLLMESRGPVSAVGELCRIKLPAEKKELMAEVVSLEGKNTRLMPYDEMEGMREGAEVVALGHRLEVPVSDRLLGRVIDPLCRPLDGKAPVASTKFYPAIREAPSAMDRPPIREQLFTGVRAIDGLLPLGKGQRVGIFSGSGVGKSTLLGMIARNTDADVTVMALIGERGREVREFIEQELDEESLKKSIIVASTSDTPALSRIRGAYSATAIAEYFRDQGKDVLLLFDSVTRFATAGREVGLSIGEPPATRGFPPSVFHSLPKLLERSGATSEGSITAIYNVLVEGDDLDEPVSDTVRGILDGHIVLSRRLAERYHFPAIDVLGSVSRLESKIMSSERLETIASIKRLMAAYREREDLIEVGAYASGSNPDVDRAIEKMPTINDFLRQKIEEHIPPEEMQRQLEELLS